MFGSTAKKLNPNDTSVEIPNPPEDTANQIVWSPNNEYFAIPSWDKKARIWHMTNNGANFAAGKEFSDYALSCDWTSDSTKLFVATADGKVNLWDIQGGSLTQVSQNLIPWCKWIPEKNLLLTASLDKTIKYWDGRQQNPVLSVDLGDYFLAGDYSNNLLVVGSGKQFLIYDINKPQNVYEKRESPLQHQTRVIKCFPNASGYVVSSPEGRVAVQYIQPGDKDRQFVFKCHRENNLIYGINDISFNTKETFATCASDGCFHFWDKDNRTKVKGFQQCGLPITCCSFSRDSRIFAYALGYDWHQGAQGYRMNEMQPHVYVMPVKPEDIEKKRK